MCTAWYMSARVRAGEEDINTANFMTRVKLSLPGTKTFV